jgi:hypothetical protein
MMGRRLVALVGLTTLGCAGTSQVPALSLLDRTPTPEDWIATAALPHCDGCTVDHEAEEPGLRIEGFQHCRHRGEMAWIDFVEAEIVLKPIIRDIFFHLNVGIFHFNGRVQWSRLNAGMRVGNVPTPDERDFEIGGLFRAGQLENRGQPVVAVERLAGIDLPVYI